MLPDVAFFVENFKETPPRNTVASAVEDKAKY